MKKTSEEIVLRNKGSHPWGWCWEGEKPESELEDVKPTEQILLDGDLTSPVMHDAEHRVKTPDKLSALEATIATQLIKKSRNKRDIRTPWSIC